MLCTLMYITQEFPPTLQYLQAIHFPPISGKITCKTPPTLVKSVYLSQILNINYANQKNPVVKA